MAPKRNKRAADSVSIDSLGCTKTSGMGGIRSLCYLFLLFLLIVSSPFVDTVLSGFGDPAVSGRTPTNWGTIIQGIFLVIGYAAIVYLGSRDIL